MYHLDPVVQKVDNAMHKINLYPVDNATMVSLINPNLNASIYLLDSDLSGGLHYPTFKQLEPE